MKDEKDPDVIKLPVAPKDNLYERLFPGAREKDRRRLDEIIATNQRGELTELQLIEISNNEARKAQGLPHLTPEELAAKILPQTGPKRVD